MCNEKMKKRKKKKKKKGEEKEKKQSDSSEGGGAGRKKKKRKKKHGNSSRQPTGQTHAAAAAAAPREERRECQRKEGRRQRGAQRDVSGKKPPEKQNLAKKIKSDREEDKGAAWCVGASSETRERKGKKGGVLELECLHRCRLRISGGSSATSETSGLKMTFRRRTVKQRRLARPIHPSCCALQPSDVYSTRSM